MLWKFAKAVDMIDAALAIHINIIQEAVQEEGDREFAGSFEQLAICELSYRHRGGWLRHIPIERLIAAIDVGGRGGTSWGYIEGLRSGSRATKNLADTYRNWGIPTAYNLASLREQNPDFPFTATGGIRDGLMVAKAVALGASFAGIGLPLLRAAMNSEQAVMDCMEEYVRGLKVCMLATGLQRLEQRASRLSWQALREEL